MALSANTGSNFAAKFGEIQTYSVGASAHIYRGAIVVIRLGNGYVFPAADDTDDSDSQLVVGHAAEEADNSSGSAGAKTVRVRQDGKVKLAFTSVAQTDIGRLACVKDDETVQRYGSGTTKVVVGRIVQIAVASTSVWVDFSDRPLRLATSLTH